MRLVVSATACVLLVAACNDGSSAGSAEAGTLRAGVAQGERAALPGERTFRDWYAACDNLNRCYAFGLSGPGTGWVRLEMAAGPGAKPTVTVGDWGQEDEAISPTAAEVDGQAFALIPRPMPDYEPVMMADVTGDRAVALIDALSDGTTLTVVSGSRRATVSLSGAAASLLWIDERQGRLGATSALIRKGDRADATVPAAPSAPIVPPAPAISQSGYGDQEGQALPSAIEALPSVVQCREETAFNPDLQDEVSSARLGQDTVLWGVPCGAGAYNFTTAWFTTRVDGSNPQRVTFPSTAEPRDVLVNAAYDPATRVMDAFDKARGIGDCGSADRWTWTERGFVLSHSAVMGECRGVPSVLWPTLWVTGE